MKTIVTLIFIFVWEFTAFLITAKDIFTSQRLNCSIDISVKKFAKKLSSSSFGSYLLGVKVFIFFLGLLECFDLLSSLYVLDIVWFCRFCLSSNFEKDFEYFPLSISNLMLVRSLNLLLVCFLIVKAHLVMMDMCNHYFMGKVKNKWVWDFQVY